jgi:endonuclease/exonuclease/phosphatase family metal-dependent hydrolase
VTTASGNPVIGPAMGGDLHVMTFNVRRRMPRPPWPSPRTWARRRALVERLLRRERPTVLGVQEALPDQAAAIRSALGPEYRTIGRGREAGGRGEGCPLFFDQSRLEPLGWRQVALSTQPDRPGSRSWGNLVPRIAVTATFRDRITAERLFVVNTHLDPFSGRSRERAAQQIRSMIAAQPHPAVVTGDFNAGGDSSTARALYAEDDLRDAWLTAREQISPAWGTFPNFREPRVGGRRLDWIAVSPAFDVVRAAIGGGEASASWASDHLPVQAVVRLAASGGQA